MKRHGMIAMLGAALCAGALSGCVERRFVIHTHLPGMPSNVDAGAVVYDEKGFPTGRSPADRQFTYYGKYRFTLVRDGYQTTIVEEDVKAPWYERFPFEFVSENLIPWTIRDVRHFYYELQPIPFIAPETVRDQAEILRARGQALGAPLESTSQSVDVPPEPRPMMPTIP